MTNPKAIFAQFLEALCAKDLKAASALLHDDFEFSSPVVQTRGKADFVEKMAPLLPIVAGHRMLAQLGEGQSVASLYEFMIETPKGKAAVVMSEWVELKDNRLWKSRLIFNAPDVTNLLG